jgi:hypothetical protein
MGLADNLVTSAPLVVGLIVYTTIGLKGKNKKKMKWVVVTLALLLIITNAYWLYGAIDQGVTLTYRD